MVFTESTCKYFSQIPFRVRSALAHAKSSVPFEYDDEPFFKSYDTLYQVWVKRKSQRLVSESQSINRQTFKNWETRFVDYGTVGLLPELSFVKIEPRLENLIVLITSSRPHERANYALRLANALQIPGANLELIRLVQRCHGYGQRMNKKDIEYFSDLQHTLNSVAKQKQKKVHMHDTKDRANTFINFHQDHLQQRVELMKTLFQCHKKRQIRPVLKEFGISPNRFYVLKNRYMIYGIWGLTDLVQQGRTGEKISSELELQIIEERLMDPSLSTNKMIKKLNLKCSKANVQKIYTKWKLSRFKKPISIRGVISHPVPERTPSKISGIEPSIKTRLPDLIKTARLKVNPSFTRFAKSLAHRKVIISNPGAIIAAPFLDQLGVVEALHTYGPETFRPSEITNNIIVNVLRIISYT
jgi:hypothetical protein